MHAPQWNIPADPFLQSEAFEQFLLFKSGKQAIFEYLVFGRGGPFTFREERVLVESNPNSYITYQLLAELYLDRGELELATAYFERALALEVASEAERQWLRNKIAECSKCPCHDAKIRPEQLLPASPLAIFGRDELRLSRVSICPCGHLHPHHHSPFQFPEIPEGVFQ